MLAVGCPAPAPDADACRSVCAEFAQAQQPDGEVVTLSAFEQEIVGTLLAQVRAGIQPVSDDAVGICRRGENPRRCEEFIGRTATDLPEGEYMLYGGFMAPNVGERGTWQVRLESECTVTRVAADGATTDAESRFERDYTINHNPGERGYVLAPMRRITSPHPSGAQRCTYRLTLQHPDNPTVIEGAWSVPGPPPTE